jgi:hypothetical protein
MIGSNVMYTYTIGCVHVTTYLHKCFYNFIYTQFAKVEASNSHGILMIYELVDY